MTEERPATRFDPRDTDPLTVVPRQYPDFGSQLSTRSAPPPVRRRSETRIDALGWAVIIVVVVVAVLTMLAMRQEPRVQSNGSSAGARDSSLARSVVDMPRSETRFESVGGAPLQGWATYCAPTPTHCQGWGGDAHLGAVPSFRYGDAPYLVTVRHGGRSTIVKVVSYCACGTRNGTPTVIDLSPAAFRDLTGGSLFLGVLAVTVSRGAAAPATDTEAIRSATANRRRRSIRFASPWISGIRRPNSDSQSSDCVLWRIVSWSWLSRPKG